MRFVKALEIIEKELYEGNGIEKGKAVYEFGYLAKNIARTITENPKFKDLSEDTLTLAIRNHLETPDYIEIIETVRRMHETAPAPAPHERPLPTEQPRQVTPEALNWGNFFRCRDAWNKDRKLTGVPEIIIKFTSKWLLTKGRLINEEQINWCRENAKNDAKRGSTEKEKRTAINLSFQEAVVTIAMMNMDNFLSGGKAGVVESYLETKRQEYINYYKVKYGINPQFAPQISCGHPQRCSAFADINE